MSRELNKEQLIQKYRHEYQAIKSAKSDREKWNAIRQMSRTNITLKELFGLEFIDRLDREIVAGA